jgi:FixJ family two-component response regulator
MMELRSNERCEHDSGSGPAARRVTIAVLDDDTAVLRSIGRLLAAHGFDAVTFSSPHSLLTHIASLDPDCLIADLALPELSGLDVQQILASQGVSCPIIFVTGQGDIRTSVRAMLGGAVDFLTKPVEADELIGALGRAVSRSVRDRELGGRRAMARDKVASLTAREREVFEQVVIGLLNKQIAANLGISEKTVKVHRGRVMRKMAVRSLAQLVRVAEQIEAAV